MISSPGYWRARTAVSRLTFRVKRRRFLWDQDLASARVRLRITIGLARTAVFAAFAAPILLAVAEGLSRIADLLGLHLGLGPVRPTLDFDPLLIGTIALGATLLGLYFAALSFIVAGRYATAPANIRELILDERIGSTYVTLVSIAVAAGASALILEYLGREPDTLTAAIVAALAAASIISFGVVGLRMFRFLSLEVLAGFVAYDIDRALDAAGSTSLGREFEDYHRRNLSSALDTYGEILHLASGSESSRQLERIALALIARWGHYATSKPCIPQTSWWFERQQVHATWWVADDARIGMALNTGTELPPRQEFDHSWVEKRLVAILRETVCSLAEQEAIEAMHSLAVRLAMNARPMAASLQLDDAIRALEIFTSQPLLDSSKPPAESKSSATTKRNALLDDIALYAANLVLGLQDAAATISAEPFWNQLDEALETGKTTAGSPLGAVLAVIQELRERLDFERGAEGRRVTPPWWIRQQVANNLYRELDRGLDKTLETFGTEIIERAKKAADPIDAVTLASRALEIASKLESHTPAIESALAALDGTRLADDKWPPRTSGDVADRTRKYLDAAIDVFAKRMSNLPPGPVNDQPDYFGQAFHILVNQCFAALVEERDERFVALFPQTFAGALTAHDHLLKMFPVPEYEPQTQLILRSGVIEDMFEISGYALIRGELGNTTAWDGCKRTWDSYLASLANTRDNVLEMLMGLMEFRDNQFALLPGEVIRTSRHMAFERYLAHKVGVEDDWRPGFGLYRGFGDEEEPEPHPSPIVQRALEGLGLAEPEAIFVAEYIAPLLPGGVSLPRKVENVREALGRRRRPRNKPDVDGGKARRRPRRTVEEATE